MEGQTQTVHFNLDPALHCPDFPTLRTWGGYQACSPLHTSHNTALCFGQKQAVHRMSLSPRWFEKVLQKVVLLSHFPKRLTRAPRQQKMLLLTLTSSAFLGLFFLFFSFLSCSTQTRVQSDTPHNVPRLEGALCCGVIRFLKSS